MEQLISSYNVITSKIKNYQNRISADRRKIQELENNLTDEVPRRIKNLEETLEQVDDYLLRIRGFIDLAEQHMTSRNELTIEAPKGYRVNLSRLKRWATMVDPLSSDDAYAKRLHLVSKCDELFLLKKQDEFKVRIKELERELGSDGSHDVEELKAEVEKISAELKEYIMSPEVWDFLQAVKTSNDEFWYREMPVEFGNSQEEPEELVLGAVGRPFDIVPSCSDYVKQNAGTFFDKDSRTIYLPYAIDNNEEFAIRIICQPGRKLVAQLDSGLRNFLFSVIDKEPAGRRRVHIFDAERLNTVLAGDLRKLEDSFALEHIPRNSEQLSAALERLAATIPDIDDMLENYDTVAEYNRNNPAEKQIIRDIVVLIGYPYAFSGKDRELANKIISGYERYGMSYITVGIKSSEDRNKSNTDISEYADEAAVHIRMTSEGTTVRKGSGAKSGFAWYFCDTPLSEEYVSSYTKAGEAIAKTTIGNEYTDRYSLTKRPEYVRKYKKLELPVGIDGKDQEQYISFEDENFAAYLVGAAGSGKSTLLHTIIAGLIRNYHPDNVELWLADFKQLEFKRYMKHLPPHVKYVLLDESPELVYDLVDKLTEEMMERQRLFARLGKQKIDQVDVTMLDRPLPVIFVILDEFSIMSQSIADSPIYKQRLQNILAKGRALGIKFLFSSQTFTTGVAGLTSTARAQIQQRIAMKGTIDEISETLELTSNIKTEQVRNWMEALPPHYALIKYRVGADTLPLVKRLLVMYFRDYEPRDRMIDNINATMHAVEKYAPDDITSYADKKPVLVDGNSFEKFDEQFFSDYIKTNRKSSDEFLLTFGVPRLMTSIKPAVLSAETRENLLMIARVAEKACAASILLSAMKSFSLQGGKVSIWAYPKSPIYNDYKAVFIKEGYRLVEGIDDICDEIRKTKELIAKKQYENRIIVLLGIERICMDFDFVDEGANASGEKTRMIEQFNGAAAKEEDKDVTDYHSVWFAHRRAKKRELKKIASSEEELKKLLAQEEMLFREEYMKKHPNVQISIGSSERKPIEMPQSRVVKQELRTGAYNAFDDFHYIMKQGSRNGMHFLMQLNSVVDLKQTGVKAEFFRHKLMFQISADDSRTLIGNKGASTTPEHICLYDDSISRFSFRPYIHRGVGWEGWYVDDDNVLVSPFTDSYD